MACQAGAIWNVCRARHRDVSVAWRGAQLTGATFTTAACPSASLPSELGLFELVFAAKSRSAVLHRGRPAGAADVRDCRAFGCCGRRVLDPDTKVTVQSATLLLLDFLVLLNT